MSVRLFLPLLLLLAAGPAVAQPLRPLAISHVEVAGDVLGLYGAGDNLYGGGQGTISLALRGRGEFGLVLGARAASVEEALLFGCERCPPLRGYVAVGPYVGAALRGRVAALSATAGPTLVVPEWRTAPAEGGGARTGFSLSVGLDVPGSSPLGLGVAYRLDTVPGGRVYGGALGVRLRFPTGRAR